MKKKMKKRILEMLVISALITLSLSITVFAAPGTGTGSGTEIISSGFDVIYDIIAAIVSAIGSLLLLWGVFEWAQSLNTQDGAAQSMAFKRVAAGFVAIVAPQLIPIIQNSVGTA